MVITRNQCKQGNSRCAHMSDGSSKNVRTIKSHKKSGVLYKAATKRSTHKIEIVEIKMDVIKSLKDLDLSQNPRDRWEEFKEEFENLLIATGTDEAKEAKKIALFLNQIGEEARIIYKSLNLSKEEKSKLETIYKAFDNYVKTKENSIAARSLFYNRYRKPGENFEEFLLDVRKLARNCNFTEELEMVRDKIIFGQQKLEPELYLKLSASENIDYDKAVTICRSYFSNPAQSTSQVNAIDKSSYYRNKQNYSKKKAGNGKQQNENIVNCKFCGQNHRRGCCPAYGKFCSACGKKNHLDAVCNTKKTGKKSRSTNTNVNFINAGRERDEKFCFTLNNFEIYANNTCSSNEFLNNFRNINDKWTETIKI